MPQAKHRYRVSVYLGKETYEEIAEIAKFIGLPVSTMTRVILETGLNISTALDLGKEIGKNGVK